MSCPEHMQQLIWARWVAPPLGKSSEQFIWANWVGPTELAQMSYLGRGGTHLAQMSCSNMQKPELPPTSGGFKPSQIARGYTSKPLSSVFAADNHPDNPCALLLRSKLRDLSALWILAERGFAPNTQIAETKLVPLWQHTEACGNCAQYCVFMAVVGLWVNCVDFASIRGM